MIEQAKVRDFVGFKIDGREVLFDHLEMRGFYPLVEHIRNGKVIGTYSFENGITNAGKNLLLNVMFNSTTPVASTAWCLGIIDNSGTPTVAATDTMSSHSWTEFTTYDEANRVAWGSGAASGQQVINSVACVFTINATGNLYGIFITSVNTKSGTTGTLWSTAPFTGVVPVVATDVIRVTYGVAA